MSNLYASMSSIALLKLAIGNSKRIGKILAQGEGKDYHDFVSNKMQEVRGGNPSSPPSVDINHAA